MTQLRPDGMPVKRLDVSRVNSLGWASQTRLHEGIASELTRFLERSCDK